MSIVFVRRRWLVIAAGAAAVAVVAAGATWLAFARESGSDRAPNLSLVLEQYRTDEPLHQVRFLFRNREPQPVVVQTAQLVSPDFEKVDPEVLDYPLPPGGTVGVALRAKYGPGICHGSVPATAQRAGAAMRLRLASGRTLDETLSLPDPHRYLDKLLREDCETQKIASSVQIGFGKSWTVGESAAGEPAVHTTLDAVIRDTNASVTVTQMAGSILYAVRPARKPLAELDSSARSVKVPLEFTNYRCDEHAVVESKQSFFFRVWISIDGGEPISTLLTPDAAAKGVLSRLISLGCHLS
jgi:hypothetical protein